MTPNLFYVQCTESLSMFPESVLVDEQLSHDKVFLKIPTGLVCGSENIEIRGYFYTFKA